MENASVRRTRGRIAVCNLNLHFIHIAYNIMRARKRDSSRFDVGLCTFLKIETLKRNGMIYERVNRSRFQF